MSFKDREYSLNVGQTLDLKKELELSPANADIDLSQIVWTVGDAAKAKVENGVLTALAPTAPGFFEVTATVGTTVGGDLQSPTASIKASTDIYIYQPATGIKVNSGYETITVNVGQNAKLNEALDKAVTLSPANTTDNYYWHIADETIVAFDDDLNAYAARKAGTTKATAYVDRWDEATLKADITIVVLEHTTEVAAISLEGPAVLAVGVTATFTVKGDKGAALAASAVALKEKKDAVWPLIHVDGAKQNDDGSVAVTVTPLAPGTDVVTAEYGKLTAEKTVTIGVPTTLKQGWQWMTLYSGSEQDPAKVFGSNIYEVRSQTDLLAYEEGEYYGTLTIEANKAYMVRAANDVVADKAFVQTNGPSPLSPQPSPLYDGWTWLAYPYHHAYAPADLQLQPAEGDRIVSKNEGFAEYGSDGWTGDLQALKPYQSYLYYNNSNAAATLVWKPEATLYSSAASRIVGEASKLCVVGEASKLCVVGEASKLYSTSIYAPSISYRFRDNMTVIASLNNEVVNDHSALQAFVGTECRGVGHTVNGLLFITVHANAGELVSFRLYDEETGWSSDVEERVVATQMLGTLRYPLQLTATESQGIAEIENKETENMRIEEYDLRGVLQSLEASPTKQSLEASPTKGRKKGSLVIRRMPNGHYQKVVVR